MKKRMAIAIVGLIVSNFSFSQQATRLYLDSLLNITDSNSSNKTDDLNETDPQLLIDKTT